MTAGIANWLSRGSDAASPDVAGDRMLSPRGLRAASSISFTPANGTGNVLYFGDIRPRWANTNLENVPVLFYGLQLAFGCSSDVMQEAESQVVTNFIYGGGNAKV